MLEAFQSHSSGWITAFVGSGISVHCNVASDDFGNRLYPLDGQHGVVIGRLFARADVSGTAVGTVELTQGYTRSAVASGGRSLMEQFWGRYVAFLCDREADRTWVLRDPTGALPCYVTRRGDVDIYFYRLEDCELLGLSSWSLNDDYLAGRLVFKVMFNRLTALTEITTLLAGECNTRRENRRDRSFHWNPLDISQTATVESREDAIRLIYDTTRAVVHAWASCFGNILHSLSGGLDSAIVLACLTDAPGKPRVVCENQYGRPGSLQDERSYARCIASRFGCKLLERIHESRFYFQLPRELLSFTPEPFFFGDIESTRNSPSLGENFDVMFTGNGGDELFFTRGLLPTTVDYVYERALGPSIFRIATNDSTCDRVPLTRILRLALWFGLLRQPWSYRSACTHAGVITGLADDLVPEDLRNTTWRDDRLIHPLYLDQCRDVPPGKIYHASLMSLAADQRYVPWPTDCGYRARALSPLLSQPLMEVCLRTPMHVLRCDGRDRGIARSAFASDLPAQIIRRCSKGGGDESYKAALVNNVAMVRKFLLDGYLVSRGFLDPVNLSKALKFETPSDSRAQVSSVLEYFLVEAWCRNWERRSRDYVD